MKSRPEFRSALDSKVWIEIWMFSFQLSQRLVARLAIRRLAPLVNGQKKGARRVNLLGYSDRNGSLSLDPFKLFWISSVSKSCLDASMPVCCRELAPLEDLLIIELFNKNFLSIKSIRKMPIVRQESQTLRFWQIDRHRLLNAPHLPD